VRYRDLLEEGRRRLAPGKRWVRFVLDQVLPHPRLVRGLARVGRLFRRLPPAGATAPWPDPPESPRARVALHLGCLTDALFPDLARDAALVLTRLGFFVDPVQGCCGALHRHAGLDESRQRRDVERLREDHDFVVSAAAGCSATEGVTDLTALLLDHAPFQGDAPAVRVAYDAPCHLLHAQGVDATGLLDAIPGVERVPLPGADRCCGAGGLYMELQTDLASQVRARKLDAIEASGADCVATGNPGCLLWLWKGLRARGSKVDVEHPVTLLARAFS
jgi:glycolate oxidase iron-sulfur subunit